MSITNHFRRDVLGNPKRADITVALRERIVAAAEYTNQQDDGLWQIWGYVPEMDCWVRVVTSEDREALITAHKDRNFTRKMKQEGRQDGEDPLPSGHRQHRYPPERRR